MNKPIIGLVPLVDTGRDSLWMLPGYMEGVANAGGVAVMLPLTDDDESIARILAVCDGILFTGGHDIHPALYGAQMSSLCGETIPARDSMETKLLKAALDADKAVLGICRGLQFLNVSLGGTLIMDIPTQRPSDVNHRMPVPYDRSIHEVSLSGPLAEVIGSDTMGVNSCHHQGIDHLAESLEVMAVAPDGMKEAVCLPGKKFVWAVQWHPEFSHKADENSRRIFQAFVNGCK